MNQVDFLPGDPLPAMHYNGIQLELIGLLRVINRLFNDAGGYIGDQPNNAKVVEASSPSLVTVKGPAVLWIPLTATSLTGGVPFVVETDTDVAVPALNTTAGQSRNDLVVARVNVGTISGYSYEVVQGTPATTGSQTTPALPTNAIPLARITRAHGAGNITNAMITDLRTPVQVPAANQA